MKLSAIEKSLAAIGSPLSLEIQKLVAIAIEAKRICRVLNQCEVKHVTDQLEEMIADLESP